MHLDRSYDNSIVRVLCAELGIDDLFAAKCRKPAKGRTIKKRPVSLGMRWPVERTNSWMSNFQLRRNTDRFIHQRLHQRLHQIALAVALVITVKLVKWADHWSPPTWPIGARLGLNLADGLKISAILPITKEFASAAFKSTTTRRITLKVHIPKRAAMALLAGVSIAGVAGASAATLGTFSSSSLGSGDSVVASCDSTGIGINYTTSYNATSQKYLVTAVNFTSVDPLCTGLMASVSLRNNTTALFTSVPAAATVVSTSFSIAVSPAVDAGLVNGASLIITG